jgi:general stress protein 26
MPIIQRTQGTIMTKNPPSPADHGQARAQLWDLIKDIRFAMFTTRHDGDHLHSRPMTTQNARVDEDDSLWFFMARSGEPVADLVADPVVNVVYADPGADCYVSISGTAAVVEDDAKKRALWSKLAEAWFPGGAADPNLALVQVRIVHANYWNVKESKLVQLFHMAKAVVTGKPPTQLGTQAEIRMR